MNVFEGPIYKRQSRSKEEIATLSLWAVLVVSIVILRNEKIVLFLGKGCMKERGRSVTVEWKVNVTMTWEYGMLCLQK